MAFGDKKKRNRKLGEPPPRPTIPRIPFALGIRMFLIGGIAVIGAAYAVWRHFTTPHVPMLEPVPAPTEIPAPDLP